jgi:prepilin-type N-terminal cleavage/methylation domain-containing protein/prepilin-type processing-associated H-X9-DG protein
MKRRPAGGNGFTLIELLVVIAIITLLMSILVPSLQNARDQARSVVCKSNLAGIGTAMITYAGEHDDYLCSGQVDPRIGANLPTTYTEREDIGMDRVGWVADLNNGRYAAPEMLHCPSSLGEVQKSIKDMSPRDLADAEYVQSLFDQGFTTNYCQSWYLIHTAPNLASGLLDDEKSWANLFGRQVRMSEGPLRTAKLMSVAPSYVPLVGDAKFNTNPNELFELRSIGRTVVLASNATDGPRFYYDEQNRRTKMQYRRRTPFLSQDYENFGGAHKRRRVQNAEGHSFTQANIMFADGHVEPFDDRYTGDAEVKTAGPDGQVDSWDLEGTVFDGVLQLGRRSLSSETLR